MWDLIIIDMNTCEPIKFDSAGNNKIPPPIRGIALHKNSLLSKSVAIELANLTRIAYRDFEIGEEKDKRGQAKYLENLKQGTFIKFLKGDMCSKLIDSYKLCSPSDVKDSINEYDYEILGIFYYLQCWLLVPDETRFGFIARQKIANGKYRIFLIFRGTREPGEWFNNSQFKQIRFLAREWEKPVTSNDEAISFGFNKMYTGYRPGLFLRFKILNQIFTCLEELFRKFMNFLFKIPKRDSMFRVVENIMENLDQCPPDSEVYFSGHSLGAALATVSALHVGKLGKFSHKPSLYTFASPRVGNPKFVKAFDTYGISCYRIANSEDIVTHLPPNSGKLLGPEMKNSKPTYSLFQRAVGAAEAYTKSPVAILTLRTQVYEHVGEPFYFTHQTGAWSSNHNMDVTYGGAILKIE
jgi:triacylglycerol lipase